MNCDRLVKPFLSPVTADAFSFNLLFPFVIVAFYGDHLMSVTCVDLVIILCLLNGLFL